MTGIPGRDAVIVGAVRTPIGKGKASGALHDVLPVDLLAHSLKELVTRTGIDPVQIDDVIAGAVTQVGDQAVNIARNAVLGAGFPETVPGTTIDRQCGSSQQAIHFAAQGVISGVSVTDLRVVNNNIHDIPGQHGLYIQSGSRTVIMGNAIRNCGLNGIKFQLQASATADSYGLTITGNTVDTTGDQGIILTTTDNSVARMFYDVTVVGNTVRNPASSGIYLDAVSRATIRESSTR